LPFEDREVGRKLVAQLLIMMGVAEEEIDRLGHGSRSAATNEAYPLVSQDDARETYANGTAQNVCEPCPAASC